MIKQIYRYCRGYLLIEIRGNALERFINQSLDSGIFFWNLKRISKDFYLADIYADDFKRFKALLRNRRCSVKIKKKNGFPFLAKKLSRRLFLPAGVVLFFLIIYIFSSFLWYIDISGNEIINQQRIIDVLHKNGVKRGVYKRNVNTEDLENELLRYIPELSWVNVSWSGTELNIEIVEKKLINKYNNNVVVANRSGVISKLIVLKGKAVVNEGDTVIKGEPLITSTSNEEARGIVKAHVWYRAEGFSSLHSQEVFESGKKKYFFGLKSGPFILWFSSYRPYFLNYQRKRLIKWRNIRLPIEIIKEEHYELNILKYDITKKTAVFMAREEAFKKILKMIGPEAVIENTAVNFVENDGNNIKLSMILKSEENIAVSGEEYKEDEGVRNR